MGTRYICDCILRCLLITGLLSTKLAFIWHSKWFFARLLYSDYGSSETLTMPVITLHVLKEKLPSLFHPNIVKNRKVAKVDWRHIFTLVELLLPIWARIIKCTHHLVNTLQNLAQSSLICCWNYYDVIYFIFNSVLWRWLTKINISSVAMCSCPLQLHKTQDRKCQQF